MSRLLNKTHIDPLSDYKTEDRGVTNTQHTLTHRAHTYTGRTLETAKCKLYGQLSVVY